jgi:hypothetical protein
MTFRIQTIAWGVLFTALLSTAYAQVSVTFNVNMIAMGVSDNLHVVGNFQDPNYDNIPENPDYQNWTPSASSGLMTDDDMDLVYSATLWLQPGRYEFKFVNGVDWADAETVPSTCTVEVNGNSNREIMVGPSPTTYNVCYGECADCGENAIRVRVDMSTVDLDGDGIGGELGEDIHPDGVHVNGSFAVWSEFIPLQDWNEDNIWEATISSYSADPIEFKFINGPSWDFPNETIFGSCGSGNGNRLILINDVNTVLPIYCWSSCDPCALPVPITFQVDMNASCTDTSPGIFLMGTATDWANGAAMSDSDGDGIWTVTLNLSPGNYEYKYRIGNSGWEGIGNRQLTVFAENPEQLSTVCFNSTQPCGEIIPPSNITFNLNLGSYTLSAGESVWIMGDFTSPSWQPGALQMNDNNGDGIWSVTVTQICPNTIQYKFTIGNPISGNYTEENADFSEIGGCGLDNAIFSDNRYLNRTSGEPITICTYFNSCQACALQNVPGCTDPNACNYNATATVNDGSCAYPGCTNPEAINYDSNAGCSDGSCICRASSTIFSDNFESYALNQLIVNQSSVWESWNTAATSNGTIVNDYAFDGSKSLKIEGTTSDLVLPIGPFSSGYNTIQFKMLLTSSGGYFNLLHQWSPTGTAYEWACDVFFDTDGAVSWVTGGQAGSGISVPLSQWFDITIDVDMNSDLGRLYIEDVLVNSWQWSINNANGTSGQNSLAGINFYGTNSSNGSGIFYIDDMQIYNTSAVACSVSGCTSSSACNFDPTATTDDGSCLFTGSICNDGNANTLYDSIDDNCNCIGFDVLPDCADEIFISEYLEGTNNNKAIELYNPSSNPVLLDGVYSMGRDPNGSGNPQLLSITGIIQPHGVRVFALDKRDPNGTGLELPISPLLEAVADTFLNPVYVQSNSPMYFNGDDAFVLVKNGNVIIDLLGKIGEDPGSGWWQPGDPATRWWTVDNSMVRKPEILQGVTSNPNVFDPSIEWDTLMVDDFSHLGWHETICGQIISGCTNSSACNFNPNATVNDGSCLIIGSSCNDSNPNTINDAIQNNCECAGTVIDPGCSGFTVSNNTSNPTCAGVQNGFISVSASGTSAPFNYTWSNGANSNTVNNIGTGAYSVIITDALGCSETLSFTISAPTALSATTSTNAVSCFGAATGTASVNVTGGTAPYSYAWNTSPIQNTSQISNVVAGNYTVNVTDANGCIYSIGASINQPSVALSVTASTTSATCSQNDGSASASVSGNTGNIQYSWSNGQTGATATNLSAGTYTVSVNSGGCSTQTTVSVNNTNAPIINQASSSPACFGANTGSINTIVTGGNQPYQYLWSNGASGTSQTGLAAGNYTFIVIDNAGCQASAVITLTQPDPINISLATAPTSCSGTPQGSVNATVSGGTQPYQYSWSNGSAGTVINNLSAGQYSLDILDANGCSANAFAQVISPDGVIAFANSSDVNCIGGNDGSMEIIITEGNPPYTYEWSNGVSGTSSINNLIAGDYSCTISDATGCTFNVSELIGEPEGNLPEILGFGIVDPFSIQTYSTSPIDGASFSWQVIGGNILSGQGSNFIQVQWSDDAPASIELVITNPNGCESILTLGIQIGTYVSEIQPTISWSIFPNPTTTNIHLILKGTNEKIPFRILDMNGREIKSEFMHEGLNTIDLSNLAAGIYSIELMTRDDRVERQRLIKH